RQRRSDGNRFVVTFEPDEERRLLGSREPLQVQPVVISPHVRINQRAEGIEFSNVVGRREHLVYRLLPLSRSEADQQGERLGSPQGFARRPLRERGTENLRTGSFGQQLDLKA